MTDEEFVKAWEESKTLNELAKAAGVTPGVASTRAARMRLAGVPLKEFRKGQPKMDVEKLKKIVKKVGK